MRRLLRSCRTGRQLPASAISVRGRWHSDREADRSSRSFTGNADERGLDRISNGLVSDVNCSAMHGPSQQPTFKCLLRGVEIRASISFEASFFEMSLAAPQSGNFVYLSRDCGWGTAWTPTPVRFRYSTRT